MEPDASPIDLDDLLGEADWLRALAGHLVHDRARGDDLAQETWLAALRSPPAAGRSPRPWLARVLHNLIRMDMRASTRRRAREQVTVELAAPPLATDAALERLELQRTLAGLLKELEEPFRSTLVLRFLEGRAPAAIARAQEIPAGTVRWRINEGLRRLRLRLDDAYGGRDRWRLALLPLAGAPPRPRGPGRGRPALLVAGAVAGASAIGALVVSLTAARRELRFTDVARSASETPNEKETSMPTPPSNKTAAAAATFFGLVLPTLVAGADAQKPLSRDEAIDHCVKWRERALPCKQEMADLMLERVPPERRPAAREKFLKQIEEGATAPLEARKASCAAELDRKSWLAMMTRADWAGIEACFNEQKTCKAALACGRTIIFRQR